MKVLVVTKQDGEIVAIGPHPDEVVSKTPGVRSFGFTPLSGQQVHSLEFPAELLASEKMRFLHKTHRIEVAEGKPRLVEKRKG
jgi:hypothetical protein